MTVVQPARTLVGPFKICDATREEVIETIASRVHEGIVAFALHVGGLNHANHEGYVDAMNSADVTYADGAAVVTLARLAGARRIERAATTDIGLPVVRRAAAHLGRPVRVALLGGPPGLAERAAARITATEPAEVVLTVDGYQPDYAAVLTRLRRLEADIVFVGMGMPREARFVTVNREAFAGMTVLTCGGWFGFLAGEERRAPQTVQRAGLEWAYRLSQAPDRLRRRYTLGLITWACLAPLQARSRWVRDYAW